MLLLTYFLNVIAALAPSRSVQSFSQVRTLSSCACFAGAAEHSKVKQRSEATKQFIKSLKPEVENDEVLQDQPRLLWKR